MPPTAPQFSTPSWHTPPDNPLVSANWFPVDLHVPRREVGFLHLPNSLVTESTFLDSRIDAPWQNPVWQPASGIAVSASPNAGTNFLFHTSFCCSTLLSRALQCDTELVGLREPLVLRRLADARFANYPADGLLEVCLALLSRPWGPNGHVLIKPTHVALPLAASMMSIASDSKAILLTSTLEDFLLSNLKKNPETQSRVPELVGRMVSAIDMPQLLDCLGPSQTPFLHLVALQWVAQQILLSQLVRRIGVARFRLVMENTLLSDIESSTLTIINWLGLCVSRDKILSNTRNAASRHAKQTDIAYDEKKKRTEADYLRSVYGKDIIRTLHWTDKTLLAVAQDHLHALTDPLLALGH